MLSLERLASLVAFADHGGSLTRTASALRLSLPALHAQLAKLSEESGVPLYTREGRRLRLTAEGERVVAFGREILARTAAFEATLQGQDAHQPVTLAAGEGSFLYLLSDAVRAFLAAEAAPLRLLTADRPEVLRLLRVGEAQVGVASLDAPPPELAAEILTTVPAALLLPPGHPLAAGGTTTPIPLAALAGARLVVPPVGTPHREAVAGALLEAGVPWTVAVEAGGWELMRRFVSLGLGLAVVNGFCPPPEGGTRRPLLGLPARRYWLLHRRDAPLTAGAARLCDLLRTHADGWR